MFIFLILNLFIQASDRSGGIYRNYYVGIKFKRRTRSVHVSVIIKFVLLFVACALFSINNNF